MTDEYAVQQAVDGEIDDPGHRFEYCDKAVRDRFGERLTERITGADQLVVDVQSDRGFLEFRHTLTAESTRNDLADTIAMTGCETVTLVSAYRDELRTVETLLRVAPREWSTELAAEYQSRTDGFWERRYPAHEIPSLAVAKHDLERATVGLLDGVLGTVVLLGVLWGLTIEVGRIVPLARDYGPWLVWAVLAIAVLVGVAHLRQELLPALSDYWTARRRT